MRDLLDDIEALRPHDPPRRGRRWRRKWATAGPEAEVIGGTVASLLVLALALALGFDLRGTGAPVKVATNAVGAAAQPSVTSTSSLPPTLATAPVTTPDLVVVPDTSPPATAPVLAPTTTTTPKVVVPTTATTARPGPIAPVSGSSTSPRVTLTLDLTAASGVRSLAGGLAALLADGQLLRSVRIDFGDGTTLPGSVNPYACDDPEAPNPYNLTLPEHLYNSPGTYPVTVVATTAPCVWADGYHLGPDTTSYVGVSVVVP